MLLWDRNTLRPELHTFADTAVQPAESDGDGWVKQKKGNKKALTQETGVKVSLSLTAPHPSWLNWSEMLASLDALFRAPMYLSTFRAVGPNCHCSFVHNVPSQLTSLTLEALAKVGSVESTESRSVLTESGFLYPRPCGGPVRHASESTRRSQQ